MLNLIIDSPWAVLAVVAIVALTLIAALIRAHRERIREDSPGEERMDQFRLEQNSRRRPRANPWAEAR